MQRTVKEVLMSDRIKKLAGKWGSQSLRKAYRCRVEFSNRMEDKFEWENDDISIGETTGEEEHI